MQKNISQQNHHSKKDKFIINRDTFFCEETQQLKICVLI